MVTIAPNPYQLFYGPTDVESMEPEEDLHDYEHCFVKLTGDKEVGHFAATDDIAYGVLQNQPIPVTGPSLIAKVQVAGVAWLKAGSGGLAAGDLVGADKDGAGITIVPAQGTDGTMIWGQCVVGAAEGLCASVRLFGGPVYIRHA